jgi:hypothetical protein
MCVFTHNDSFSFNIFSYVITEGGSLSVLAFICDHCFAASYGGPYRTLSVLS